MPVSSCLIELALYNTDASLREVGLNLAVATMRKGERCHLQVQPQYGYGERGTHPFICWQLDEYGCGANHTLLMSVHGSLLGVYAFPKMRMFEKC